MNLDERDAAIWVQEAKRLDSRRRLYAIEAAAFPHMEPQAREALVMQLQADMQTFQEAQEAEWAANRRALRRFLGG